MTNLPQKITARVENLVRLQSSHNGNPRWKVTTDQGTYRTKRDASVAYFIDNHHRGRLVRLTLQNNEIVFAEEIHHDR